MTYIFIVFLMWVSPLVHDAIQIMIRAYPANTKHLYNICTMLDQRRRRWADAVQMLYKCFVFDEYVS